MAAIALTFDNGPDPAATPAVLDTLEKHGVSASFFVVGCKAATSVGASLLRDIHAAGHRIGNHTWSHSKPLGEMEDAAASVSEIVRTEAAIGAFADPQKLFRPFGRRGARGAHLLSAAAFRHLVAERYTCVLWNCVPRDWDDADGWVVRAREQVNEREAPYLVLHDIAGACANRLDEFVGMMRDAGHTFTPDVPGSEIIIDSGVPRPNAGRYVTPDA